RIHTRDGAYVIVPNNTISKESITNYSEPVLAARLHVDVGATYLKTPNDVKAALLEALAQSPLVLQSPPPRIMLHEFAASAINYRVFFGVADFEKEPAARDQVRTAIYYSFRRRDIEMPWPIQVEYSNTAMPSVTMPQGAIADALRAVDIFAALGDAEIVE